MFVCGEYAAIDCTKCCVIHVLNPITFIYSQMYYIDII